MDKCNGRKTMWSTINIVYGWTHLEGGYLDQGRPTDPVRVCGSNRAHQLWIFISHSDTVNWVMVKSAHVVRPTEQAEQTWLRAQTDKLISGRDQ